MIIYLAIIISIVLLIVFMFMSNNNQKSDNLYQISRNIEKIRQQDNHEASKKSFNFPHSYFRGLLTFTPENEALSDNKNKKTQSSHENLQTQIEDVKKNNAIIASQLTGNIKGLSFPNIYREIGQKESYGVIKGIQPIEKIMPGDAINNNYIGKIKGLSLFSDTGRYDESSGIDNDINEQKIYELSKKVINGDSGIIKGLHETNNNEAKSLGHYGIIKGLPENTSETNDNEARSIDQNGIIKGIYEKTSETNNEARSIDQNGIIKGLQEKTSKTNNEAISLGMYGIIKGLQEKTNKTNNEAQSFGQYGIHQKANEPSSSNDLNNINNTTDDANEPKQHIIINKPLKILNDLGVIKGITNKSENALFNSTSSEDQTYLLDDEEKFDKMHGNSKSIGIIKGLENIDDKKILDDIHKLKKGYMLLSNDNSNISTDNNDNIHNRFNFV